METSYHPHRQRLAETQPPPMQGVRRVNTYRVTYTDENNRRKTLDVKANTILLAIQEFFSHRPGLSVRAVERLPVEISNGATKFTFPPPVRGDSGHG